MPSHSSGTTNAQLMSNDTGRNGTIATHSARPIAFCSGSTSAGAARTRFCSSEPTVSATSAVSAHAMPPADRPPVPPLTPRPTTSARPVSDSASPAMRTGCQRRSTIASVRIGCTPRIVASTPGAMPRSSASR